MRLIDADELYRAKFHGVAEIVPPDEKNGESYKRGWNDALDAVADESCTPTIDLHNWIPCSVKLPKPGEKVLVCLVDRRRRKVATKYGGERLYTIRIDKIVKYTEETIPFWAKGNTPSVLAWMPLPEAYRGGQENETD